MNSNLDDLLSHIEDVLGEDLDTKT